MTLLQKSFKLDHFVNKIVEIRSDTYLCATWDAGQFLVVGPQEIKSIQHPSGQPFRCWGLKKVNDVYICRDNFGICVVDLVSLQVK